MTSAQIGLVAIAAYAMAFVGRVAYSSRLSWRCFLFFLTWIAIISHGLQLHRLIDLPLGQNLSWVNLLSLLAWLSVLLIALADYVLPVASLGLLVYPVAIVLIGLSEFLHPTFILVTKFHPPMLMHILLATFVVALLFICGIQALLLMLQQFSLKQKKMLSLLELLPPLQVMEQLLFFEIGLSFLSLSLFFIATLYGFEFSLVKIFWRETLLSILLWGIFLVLLIGRYLLKWHSARSAMAASLGVAIALVLYLMSHIRMY